MVPKNRAKEGLNIQEMVVNVLLLIYLIQMGECSDGSVRFFSLPLSDDAASKEEVDAFLVGASVLRSNILEALTSLLHNPEVTLHAEQRAAIEDIHHGISTHAIDTIDVIADIMAQPRNNNREQFLVLLRRLQETVTPRHLCAIETLKSVIEYGDVDVNKVLQGSNVLTKKISKLKSQWLVSKKFSRISDGLKLSQHACKRQSEFYNHVFQEVKEHRLELSPKFLLGFFPSISYQYMPPDVWQTHTFLTDTFSMNQTVVGNILKQVDLNKYDNLFSLLQATYRIIVKKQRFLNPNLAVGVDQISPYIIPNGPSISGSTPAYISQFTNKEEWVKELFHGCLKPSFPKDIVEACSKVQEEIINRKLGLTEEELSVMFTENGNKYSVLISMLRKISVNLSQSDGFTSYINALLEYLKMKLSIDNGVVYSPKTAGEIAGLLNSFETANLPKNTSEAMEEVRSILIRTIANWEIILEKFPFHLYSTPRSLIVHILTWVLKQKQTPFANHEICYISQFLDSFIIKGNKVILKSNSRRSALKMVPNGPSTCIEKCLDGVQGSYASSKNNKNSKPNFEDDQTMALAVDTETLLSTLRRDTPPKYINNLREFLSSTRAAQMLQDFNYNIYKTRGKLFKDLLLFLRMLRTADQGLIATIDNTLKYIQVTGPGGKGFNITEVHTGPSINHSIHATCAGINVENLPEQDKTVLEKVLKYFRALSAKPIDNLVNSTKRGRSGLLDIPGQLLGSLVGKKPNNKPKKVQTEPPPVKLKQNPLVSNKLPGTYRPNTTSCETYISITWDISGVKLDPLSILEALPASSLPEKYHRILKTIRTWFMSGDIDFPKYLSGLDFSKFKTKGAILSAIFLTLSRNENIDIEFQQMLIELSPYITATDKNNPIFEIPKLNQTSEKEIKPEKPMQIFDILSIIQEFTQTLLMTKDKPLKVDILNKWLLANVLKLPEYIKDIHREAYQTKYELVSAILKKLLTTKHIESDIKDIIRQLLLKLTAGEEQAKIKEVPETEVGVEKWTSPSSWNLPDNKIEFFIDEMSKLDLPKYITDRFEILKMWITNNPFYIENYLPKNIVENQIPRQDILNILANLSNVNEIDSNIRDIMYKIVSHMKNKGQVEVLTTWKPLYQATTKANFGNAVDALYLSRILSELRKQSPSQNVKTRIDVLQNWVTRTKTNILQSCLEDINVSKYSTRNDLLQAIFKTLSENKKIQREIRQIATFLLKYVTNKEENEQTGTPTPEMTTVYAIWKSSQRPSNLDIINIIPIQKLTAIDQKGVHELQKWLDKEPLALKQALGGIEMNNYENKSEFLIDVFKYLLKSKNVQRRIKSIMKNLIPYIKTGTVEPVTSIPLMQSTIDYDGTIDRPDSQTKVLNIMETFPRHILPKNEQYKFDYLIKWLKGRKNKDILQYLGNMDLDKLETKKEMFLTLFDRLSAHKKANKKVKEILNTLIKNIMNQEAGLGTSYPPTLRPSEKYEYSQGKTKAPLYIQILGEIPKIKLPKKDHIKLVKLQKWLEKNPVELQKNINNIDRSKYKTKDEFLTNLFEQLSNSRNVDKEIREILKSLIPYVKYGNTFSSTPPFKPIETTSIAMSVPDLKFNILKVINAIPKASLAPDEKRKLQILINWFRKNDKFIDQAMTQIDLSSYKTKSELIKAVLYELSVNYKVEKKVRDALSSTMHHIEKRIDFEATDEENFTFAFTTEKIDILEPVVVPQINWTINAFKLPPRDQRKLDSIIKWLQSNPIYIQQYLSGLDGGINITQPISIIDFLETLSTNNQVDFNIRKIINSLMPQMKPSVSKIVTSQPRNITKQELQIPDEPINPLIIGKLPVVNLPKEMHIKMNTLQQWLQNNPAEIQQVLKIVNPSKYVTDIEFLTDLLYELTKKDNIDPYIREIVKNVIPYIGEEHTLPKPIEMEPLEQPIKNIKDNPASSFFKQTLLEEIERLKLTTNKEDRLVLTKWINSLDLNTVKQYLNKLDKTEYKNKGEFLVDVFRLVLENDELDKNIKNILTPLVGSIPIQLQEQEQTISSHVIPQFENGTVTLQEMPTVPLNLSIFNSVYRLQLPKLQSVNIVKLQKWLDNNQLEIQSSVKDIRENAAPHEIFKQVFQKLDINKVLDPDVRDMLQTLTLSLNSGYGGDTYTEYPVVHSTTVKYSIMKYPDTKTEFKLPNIFFKPSEKYIPLPEIKFGRDIFNIRLPKIEHIKFAKLQQWLENNPGEMQKYLNSIDTTKYKSKHDILSNLFDQLSNSSKADKDIREIAASLITYLKNNSRIDIVTEDIDNFIFTTEKIDIVEPVIVPQVNWTINAFPNVELPAKDQIKLDSIIKWLQSNPAYIQQYFGHQGSETHNGTQRLSFIEILESLSTNNQVDLNIREISKSLLAEMKPDMSGFEVPLAENLTREQWHLPVESTQPVIIGKIPILNLPKEMEMQMNTFQQWLQNNPDEIQEVMKKVNPDKFATNTDFIKTIFQELTKSGKIDYNIREIIQRLTPYIKEIPKSEDTISWMTPSQNIRDNTGISLFKETIMEEIRKLDLPMNGEKKIVDLTNWFNLLNQNDLGEYLKKLDKTEFRSKRELLQAILKLMLQNPELDNNIRDIIASTIEYISTQQVEPKRTTNTYIISLSQKGSHPSQAMPTVFLNLSVLDSIYKLELPEQEAMQVQKLQKWLDNNQEEIHRYISAIDKSKFNSPIELLSYVLEKLSINKELDTDVRGLLKTLILSLSGGHLSPKTNYTEQHVQIVNTTKINLSIKLQLPKKEQAKFQALQKWMQTNPIELQQYMSNLDTNKFKTQTEFLTDFFNYFLNNKNIDSNIKNIIIALTPYINSTEKEHDNLNVTTNTTVTTLQSKSSYILSVLKSLQTLPLPENMLNTVRTLINLFTENRDLFDQYLVDFDVSRYRTGSEFLNAISNEMSLWTGIDGNIKKLFASLTDYITNRETGYTPVNITTITLKQNNTQYESWKIPTTVVNMSIFSEIPKWKLPKQHETRYNILQKWIEANPVELQQYFTHVDPGKYQSNAEIVSGLYKYLSQNEKVDKNIRDIIISLSPYIQESNTESLAPNIESTNVPQMSSYVFNILEAFPKESLSINEQRKYNIILNWVKSNPNTIDKYLANIDLSKYKTQGEILSAMLSELSSNNEIDYNIREIFNNFSLYIPSKTIDTQPLELPSKLQSTLLTMSSLELLSKLPENDKMKFDILLKWMENNPTALQEYLSNIDKSKFRTNNEILIDFFKHISINKLADKNVRDIAISLAPYLETYTKVEITTAGILELKVPSTEAYIPIRQPVASVDLQSVLGTFSKLDLPREEQAKFDILVKWFKTNNLDKYITNIDMNKFTTEREMLIPMFKELISRNDIEPNIRQILSSLLAYVPGSDITIKPSWTISNQPMTVNILEAIPKQDLPVQHQLKLDTLLKWIKSNPSVLQQFMINTDTSKYQTNSEFILDLFKYLPNMQSIDNDIKSIVLSLEPYVKREDASVQIPSSPLLKENSTIIELDGATYTPGISWKVLNVLENFPTVSLPVSEQNKMEAIINWIKENRNIVDYYLARIDSSKYNSTCSLIIGILRELSSHDDIDYNIRDMLYSLVHSLSLKDKEKERDENMEMPNQPDKIKPSGVVEGSEPGGSVNPVPQEVAVNLPDQYNLNVIPQPESIQLELPQYPQLQFRQPETPQNIFSVNMLNPPTDLQPNLPREPFNMNVLRPFPQDQNKPESLQTWPDITLALPNGGQGNVNHSLNVPIQSNHENKSESNFEISEKERKLDIQGILDKLPKSSLPLNIKGGYDVLLQWLIRNKDTVDQYINKFDIAKYPTQEQLLSAIFEELLRNNVVDDSIRGTMDFLVSYLPSPESKFEIKQGDGNQLYLRNISQLPLSFIIDFVPRSVLKEEENRKLDKLWKWLADNRSVYQNILSQIDQTKFQTSSDFMKNFLYLMASSGQVNDEMRNIIYKIIPYVKDEANLSVKEVNKLPNPNIASEITRITLNMQDLFAPLWKVSLPALGKNKMDILMKWFATNSDLVLKHVQNINLGKYQTNSDLLFAILQNLLKDINISGDIRDSLVTLSAVTASEKGRKDMNSMSFVLQNQRTGSGNIILIVDKLLDELSLYEGRKEYRDMILTTKDWILQNSVEVQGYLQDIDMWEYETELELLTDIVEKLSTNSQVKFDVRKIMQSLSAYLRTDNGVKQTLNRPIVRSQGQETQTSVINLTEIFDSFNIESLPRNLQIKFDLLLKWLTENSAILDKHMKNLQIEKYETKGDLLNAVLKSLSVDGQVEDPIRDILISLPPYMTYNNTVSINMPEMFENIGTWNNTGMILDVFQIIDALPKHMMSKKDQMKFDKLNNWFVSNPLYIQQYFQNLDFSKYRTKADLLSLIFKELSVNDQVDFETRDILINLQKYILTKGIEEKPVNIYELFIHPNYTDSDTNPNGILSLLEAIPKASLSGENKRNLEILRQWFSGNAQRFYKYFDQVDLQKKTKEELLLILFRQLSTDIQTDEKIKKIILSLSPYVSSSEEGAEKITVPSYQTDETPTDNSIAVMATDPEYNINLSGKPVNIFSLFQAYPVHLLSEGDRRRLDVLLLWVLDHAKDLEYYLRNLKTDRYKTKEHLLYAILKELSRNADVDGYIGELALSLCKFIGMDAEPTVVDTTDSHLNPVRKSPNLWKIPEVARNVVMNSLPDRSKEKKKKDTQMTSMNDNTNLSSERLESENSGNNGSKKQPLSFFRKKPSYDNDDKTLETSVTFPETSAQDQKDTEPADNSGINMKPMRLPKIFSKQGKSNNSDTWTMSGVPVNVFKLLEDLKNVLLDESDRSQIQDLIWWLRDNSATLQPFLKDVDAKKPKSNNEILYAVMDKLMKYEEADESIKEIIATIMKSIPNEGKGSTPKKKGPQRPKMFPQKMRFPG